MLLLCWGGDEFLVIMPYSDELYPLSLLERVESELGETSAKLGIPIFVSIGKSIYPDEANSLVDLVRFADEHMYELKFQKKQTVGTV